MPRLIMMAMLILSMVLSGCAASQAADLPSTPVVPVMPLQVKPATPVLTPQPSISPLSMPSNPFGLLLGGENMTDQLRVDLVKALGVTYFRPWYTTIEDWNGACLDPACDLAQAAGLKLILTVRNNAVLGGTTPAVDLAAYRKTLGAILDAYHPEVLVVENEESSPTSWAGTPDQYAAQLKAACDVAHQKNIRCTNGGLDSQTLGLLVWADLIEHGSITEACDFAQRAAADLPADLCRLTAVNQLFPAYQDQIARGRWLIALYPSSSQDYLNFHWYAPDQSAFSTVAAYLQRVTQLPLMSNELGQRDQLSESINTLLSSAIDRQLRYAIWFSLDRGSQALQDANGALRPNGEAFRDFMQAHYQSTTALPAVTPAPKVVAEAPKPAATLPSFTSKPVPAAPSGALAFSQTLNDVTYCTTDEGVELKMDLYFPIKPAGPAPVVMFVHGGGWVAGTKADIPGLSYFLQLARRGYLIASIDYRLAPKYKFPANIEDVKCAVRSLRAHATDWNLDPNRIGAWGDSAGGHLVALLGTSDKSAGWDVGQYLDQSSRVQVVVDLYGIADLTTDFVVGGPQGLDRMVFNNTGPTDPILRAASATTYITPDDPPFLIMHGDLDEIVPISQSAILHTALIAAGVPSIYVPVHNAGHGFAALGGPIDPSFPVIASTILNFFDQYLR